VPAQRAGERLANSGVSRTVDAAGPDGRPPGRLPAPEVLVLTTFDTDTDVLPAIEAGATGYLLKDSPPEELRREVRAAARGEAVLSPSVATRLVGQVREPAREPLSQRELDILGLISHGCSNREAAARLFISEATVKTHVLQRLRQARGQRPGRGRGGRVRARPVAPTLKTRDTSTGPRSGPGCHSRPWPARRGSHGPRV
jgi:DNA-binding CsgD family transcriptional regulator